MTPRRRDDPTLYLVAWDGGIIKIGFSGRHRWRAFPKARLLLAVPCASGCIGYDLEIGIHEQAFRIWPRAFATKTDAIPYLGRSGEGYLECYRATDAEAVDLVASRCGVTVWRHDAASHIDGRTDVLTKTHLQAGRNHAAT